MHGRFNVAILDRTGAIFCKNNNTQVFTANQAIGFPKLIELYHLSDPVGYSLLPRNCLHLHATVTVPPS